MEIATAAALNRWAAWTSGVSGVMPAIAVWKSLSACLTRLVVAVGTSGAGVVVLDVFGEAGGVDVFP